jgi:hypothetical protein
MLPSSVQMYDRGVGAGAVVHVPVTKCLGAHAQIKGGAEKIRR